MGNFKDQRFEMGEGDKTAAATTDSAAANAGKFTEANPEKKSNTMMYIIAAAVVAVIVIVIIICCTGSKDEYAVAKAFDGQCDDATEHTTLEDTFDTAEECLAACVDTDRMVASFKTKEGDEFGKCKCQHMTTDDVCVHIDATEYETW